MKLITIKSNSNIYFKCKVHDNSKLEVIYDLNDAYLPLLEQVLAEDGLIYKYKDRINHKKKTIIIKNIHEFSSFIERFFKLECSIIKITKENKMKAQLLKELLDRTHIESENIQRNILEHISLEEDENKDLKNLAEQAVNSLELLYQEIGSKIGNINEVSFGLNDEENSLLNGLYDYLKGINSNKTKDEFSKDCLFDRLKFIHKELSKDPLSDMSEETN